MTILIIDSVKENRERYLFKLLKRYTQRKFTSLQEAIICPDIHILSSANGNSISIEQVNKLNSEMIYKPFELAVQVGVIIDSQLLTIEAQNALLKSLEDHSDKTIYILLVNNEFNLLETIVSRCKKYYANRRKKGNRDNTRLPKDLENISSQEEPSKSIRNDEIKSINNQYNSSEFVEEEEDTEQRSQIKALSFALLSQNLLKSFQSIIKIIDIEKEEKEKLFINAILYNLMSNYKAIYESIDNSDEINVIIENIDKKIARLVFPADTQDEQGSLAKPFQGKPEEEKTILHLLCNEVTKQKISTQNSAIMNRIRASIEAIEFARNQIEASTNKKLVLENMILKLRRLADSDLK